MGFRYTIVDMQELANLKEGRCLSKEYWDTDTPLSWRCKNGHNWEAPPKSLIRGAWCPQCLSHNSREQRLEEVREIAESKGGKCLSQKYVTTLTKMQWECAEGHRWLSTPTSIKSGHWCHHCGGMAKLTIGEMQAIAKSRGGKCLSKKYINGHTKLQWECKEGHRWFAAPAIVKYTSWCMQCAGHAKFTIEQMRELARSKGGKCLSEKYISVSSKLQWECKKGHRWLAPASDVKTGGHWCPHCAGVAKLTIEEMHAIAKSRGGRCLSKEYVNGRTKLEWECKKGHRWLAASGHIKMGQWCRQCAGTAKLTIEEMHAIAKSRGGKCLSTKYVNATTNLQWECKEGHRWHAQPVAVKHVPTWCPYCGGNIKLTIEEMQAIAKSRGGKCLSKKYVNTHTNLEWECKKGHRWKNAPDAVKNSGQWCPYCAGKAKHTIEEMQAIAKSRGGKCLSKRYINSKTHLYWECKNKHRWKATPNRIQQGTWCPACAGRQTFRK